jgi:UDP-N-acetylmuramyl pentapeptide phosphotransferase/UDP-N-acetylglucosamine-1-phosphate transferase
MIKIGIKLILTVVLLAVAILGCSSAMLLLDAPDTLELIVGIVAAGGIALATLYVLDKLWWEPVRFASLTKEHSDESTKDSPSAGCNCDICRRMRDDKN